MKNCGRMSRCSVLCLALFGPIATASEQIKSAPTGKTCDSSVVNGEVEYTMTWSGPCKAGKPHGKGVMAWAEDQSVVKEYEGEVQNGLPHGRGVLKAPDGRRFDGMFAAGEAVSGSLFFGNGDKYDGPLVNAVPEGSGRVSRVNGDSYDAIFRGGLPVGVSSYAFGGDRLGGRFIGMVENHFPHGDGVYFNPDGSSFTVRFDRGSVVSFGEFKYTNGDRWQGPIKVNQPDGKGVLLLANGDRIEGVLDKDKFVAGAKYFFAKGGVFVGDLDGNAPKGYGLLHTASGDRIRGKIGGGFFEGPGEIRMADGRYYQGKLEKSLPKGAGLLILPTGERIETEFDGTLDVEGKLKLVHSNGDVFVGETRRYLPNGGGEFIARSGHRYLGTFKDGLPHGTLEVTYANGSSYRGAFVDGERSGKGVMVWADGTRYDGQFAAGLPHGQGALDDAGGVRYTGEFLRGLPSGKGKLGLPSGRSIEGMFGEALAQGTATAAMPDQSRFSGSFAESQPEGSGSYTDPAGKVHPLVFFAGVPKSDEGPFFSYFKNKAEELKGLIDAGFFAWAQSYALKHEKWFAERDPVAKPLMDRLRTGLREPLQWKSRYLGNLAAAQAYDVGRLRSGATLTSAKTLAESARKPLETLRGQPILKSVRDELSIDPVAELEPVLGAAVVELTTYLISSGQLDEAQRVISAPAAPLSAADRQLVGQALAELVMRSPMTVSRQQPLFDRLLGSAELPGYAAVSGSLKKSADQAASDGDTAQAEAIGGVLKKLARAN